MRAMTYRRADGQQATVALRQTIEPCAVRRRVLPTDYAKKERHPQGMPFFFWRRGRDSNPRVVSHKLISSQPRYDRFDISAY